MQSAQPTAERRDGDRPDPTRADLPGQRLQPGLDVFKSALATPVPLGREVDDVAGGNHRTRLEDEHTPRPHRGALAPGGVCLEVLGKRALELKRDPAPHHADAVDGVDQGLRRLREDVASLVRDHGTTPPLSSTTLDGFRRAACARPLRGRLRSGSRPAVTGHRYARRVPTGSAARSVGTRSTRPRSMGTCGPRCSRRNGSISSPGSCLLGIPVGPFRQNDPACGLRRRPPVDAFTQTIEPRPVSGDPQRGIRTIEQQAPHALAIPVPANQPADVFGRRSIAARRHLSVHEGVERLHKMQCTARRSTGQATVTRCCAATPNLPAKRHRGATPSPIDARTVYYPQHAGPRRRCRDQRLHRFPWPRATPT